MKLYCVIGAAGFPRYFSSQADAAPLARRLAQSWERIELPTTKFELIAWLNAASDRAAGSQNIPADRPASPDPAQEPPAARCPNCKRDHAEAERVASLAERAAVLAACEEKILTGDANLLSALAGVVIIRLDELRQGV